MALVSIRGPLQHLLLPAIPPEPPNPLIRYLKIPPTPSLQDRTARFKVGQRVRAVPPAGRERLGTWKLFAGTEGTVEQVDPRAGEIGVTGMAGFTQKTVFFTPDELVPVRLRAGR